MNGVIKSSTIDGLIGVDIVELLSPSESKKMAYGLFKATTSKGPHWIDYQSMGWVFLALLEVKKDNLDDPIIVIHEAPYLPRSTSKTKRMLVMASKNYKIVRGED